MLIKCCLSTCLFCNFGFLNCFADCKNNLRVHFPDQLATFVDFALSNGNSNKILSELIESWIRHRRIFFFRLFLLGLFLFGLFLFGLFLFLLFLFLFLLLFLLLLFFGLILFILFLLYLFFFRFFLFFRHIPSWTLFLSGFVYCLARRLFLYVVFVTVGFFVVMVNNMRH